MFKLFSHRFPIVFSHVFWNQNTFRTVRIFSRFALKSTAFVAPFGATLYFGNVLLCDSSLESFEIEPVSKKPIPKTLNVDELNTGNKRQFNLIGVGPREVTFIGVAVYVIGIYTDLATKSKVQSQKWKEYNEKEFIDGKPEGIAYMKDLVRGDSVLCLRLEPIRNTNSQHMLAGFMRNLNSRLAKEAADMTEQQKLEASAGLNQFKSSFPSGRFPPNVPILFVKESDGALRMEYQGRTILVKSRWVAERFFEMYLQSDKIISWQLRKSVANGLAKLTINE